MPTIAHMPANQIATNTHTSRGKPRQRGIPAGRNLSPADTDDTPPKYPLLAIEALKRHAGRYRVWTDPEEIYRLGVEYFERAVETLEPITITGLSCYLGTTRETLNDYEVGNHAGPNGDDPRFTVVIKHLKGICQHFAENHGFHARNPAFAIFVLKNYGWTDAIRLEQHISVEHSIDPATAEIIQGYLTQLSQAQIEGHVIDVEPVRIEGAVKVKAESKPVRKVIKSAKKVKVKSLPK